MCFQQIIAHSKFTFLRWSITSWCHHTFPRIATSSSSMTKTRHSTQQPLGRVFTKAENDALLKGVETIGFGKWLEILNANRNVFHQSRTGVNLKDRYRNLVKKGVAPRRVNTWRRKRVPFSPAEYRNILVGVNTIGVDWNRILKAGVKHRVFRQRRTSTDLNNAYRTLVRQGLARFHPKENEDCFTEAAMKKFHLVQGEQASFL